jgi:hypothetical protein
MTVGDPAAAAVKAPGTVSGSKRALLTEVARLVGL